MRSRTGFHLFAIAILAIAMSACVRQSPTPDPAPTAQEAGDGGGRRRARPPAYPEHAPASPAAVARGQRLFQANCGFCHGSDARGGETGPNLLRRVVVLADQHGEHIAPIVQNGIPARGMPSFKLSIEEIAAIADWLHAQPMSTRGEPTSLDIVVGDVAAGEAYFNGAGGCTRCHSVTGDLAGIGSRYDAKTIQGLIVSGEAEGRSAPSSEAPKRPPTTVTVTLDSGEVVSGELHHISAFVVALTEADGTYRSFARHGSTPKVVVTDPLQWHKDMLPKWSDSDIHDLTAYLVTLK